MKATIMGIYNHPTRWGLEVDINIKGIGKHTHEFLFADISPDPTAITVPLGEEFCKALGIVFFQWTHNGAYQGEWLGGQELDVDCKGYPPTITMFREKLVDQKKCFELQELVNWQRRNMRHIASELRGLVGQNCMWYLDKFERLANTTPEAGAKYECNFRRRQIKREEADKYPVEYDEDRKEKYIWV